ncbi:hypothetical protein [Cryobacterium adonitolivorans]|nr:hypothetical protein [Cryobacterium adonitolivorans]
MDSGYIVFAGLGVTASVDLVAESRWWFLPAGPIGFAAFCYNFGR